MGINQDKYLSNASIAAWQFSIKVIGRTPSTSAGNNLG
jgi:hypothetical protein